MPKRKIRAYHSAKVRKVRDTLVSPENSAEQFKKRVKNYEYDGWHRNWGNQQDDGAARKSMPKASRIPKIAPDAPTVG